MNVATPQTAINPFRNLPELMKQILLHEENTEINQEIMDQNGLSIKQNTLMMALIRKVILQEVPPQKVLDVVKKDLGLDDSGAKKLTLDLLGRRFLPMQWYIGNVETEITKLGGDVAKYEAEARKNYPEVYAPKVVEQPEEDVQPTVKESTSIKDELDQPAILHNLEEKLNSNKGRAGVLLHLTNLSIQIEERVAKKTITPEAGQEMIHSLDSLSYAVNTKDLNPLEIAAIKRKIHSVLKKLGS